MFDRIRSHVDTLAEIFFKDVLIVATPEGHRSLPGMPPEVHGRCYVVSAAVHGERSERQICFSIDVGSVPDLLWYDGEA